MGLYSIQTMAMRFMLFILSVWFCQASSLIHEAPSPANIGWKLAAIQAIQHANYEALAKLTTDLQQLSDHVNSSISGIQHGGGRIQYGSNLVSAASFSASLSSQVQLEAEETVYFDRVATNVGGRYFPTHGMFLCPLDGTHFFTWTVHAMSDQRAVVDVRKNSEDLAHGPLTTWTEGKSSGTYELSALVYCNMDDAVWIRAHSEPNQTCNLEGEFNSFTGIHLF